MQLDRTIDSLAKRYNKWYHDYKWSCAHPQRYTIDEATNLYELKEATFAMMIAIIPDFVIDDTHTMVAEAVERADKKLNQTIKTRIVKWLQIIFKR